MRFLLFKKLIWLESWTQVKLLTRWTSINYFIKVFSCLFIYANKVLHNGLTAKNFSINKKLNQLVDIVINDFIYNYWRFNCIFYVNNLLVNSLNLMIIKLNNNTIAYSSIFLYKNADWIEKEIWEMFGIKFALNLKLSRLLLNYNVRDFPLRKDYQIIGLKNSFFNIEKNTLLIESCTLNE